MKKSELMLLLSELPDFEILLARDAEGNGFSGVDEISIETDEELELVETNGPVLIVWPI